MKAIKGIAGLVGLFVVMPIWFYLMFKILTLVNATELMWFLYWIYIPFSVLVGVITKLVDE